MSIIKINIPGFDNDLAVKARQVGPMYEVSGSQMNLLADDWFKDTAHTCYFYRSEVTVVKPILFRFTKSAKAYIPSINTHYIVRAIREDDCLFGPVYVVSISELRAAGIPSPLICKGMRESGSGRIMIRNTLPVHC